MNIRTPLLVLGLHLPGLLLTVEAVLNISCGFQQAKDTPLLYGTRLAQQFNQDSTFDCLHSSNTRVLVLYALSLTLSYLTGPSGPALNFRLWNYNSIQ